jgi:prepilin signal peptidase PulO-like enzyme (type II secretory pathway)
MDNLALIILAASVAASGALGILAGYGAVFVFNKIPAKWLCDYDEVPDERHLPPRIGKYPWALLFSLVFATAAFKSCLISLLYAAAAFPALWLLLMIGLSDVKYRIIPDQFVILLAVTGIGFAVRWQPLGSGAVLRNGFLSPLIGLLAGGGIFFIIALLGKLIARKEVMGFGDVKLAAVCGLIVGHTGILPVLAMTALSSAALFSFWLARGRIKATDEAPLGPFIAGSTAVYLMFSEEIGWLLSVNIFPIMP